MAIVEEFNDYGLVPVLGLNVVTAIALCLLTLCLARRFPQHFRPRFSHGLRKAQTGEGIFAQSQMPHTHDVKAARSERPPKLKLFHRGAWMLGHDMLRLVGEDVFLFLAFVKYCCGAFVVFGPVAAAMILVYASDDYSRRYAVEHPEQFSKVAWRPGIQQWSLRNVSPESTWRLWLAVVADIILTLLVWCWINATVQKFRFAKQDATVSAAMVRTVRISTTPDACSRITQWVSDVVPETLRDGIVCIRAPRAQPEGIKLLKERSSLILELEEALGHELHERKTQRVWSWRHMRRVPLVSDLERKLGKLDEKIQRAIEDYRMAPHAGVLFITFRSVSLCVRFMTWARENKIKCKWAPAPSDVRWSDLHRRGFALRLRRFIVFCFVFVMAFTWTIPIGFLSNLNNLAGIPVIGVPFEFFMDWNPSLAGFVNGYLPYIVALAFTHLLPKIMRGLSGWECPHTQSAFDSRTLRKIVGFQFMALVFLQTLFSGGLEALPHLVKNTRWDTITAQVSIIVSPTVPFFLTFVIHTALVGGWTHVMRLPELVWSWWHGRKASTEKGKLYAWEAEEFHPWREYSFFLVVGSIPILFAVTVPLMAVLGLVLFASLFFAYLYLGREVYPVRPGTFTQFSVSTTVMFVFLFLCINHLGVAGALASRGGTWQVIVIGALWICNLLLALKTFKQLRAEQRPSPEVFLHRYRHLDLQLPVGERAPNSQLIRTTQRSPSPSTPNSREPILSYGGRLVGIGSSSTSSGTFSAAKELQENFHFAPDEVTSVPVEFAYLSPLEDFPTGSNDVRDLLALRIAHVAADDEESVQGMNSYRSNSPRSQHSPTRHSPPRQSPTRAASDNSLAFSSPPSTRQAAASAAFVTRHPRTALQPPSRPWGQHSINNHSGRSLSPPFSSPPISSRENDFQALAAPSGTQSSAAPPPRAIASLGGAPAPKAQRAPTPKQQTQHTTF